MGSREYQRLFESDFFLLLPLGILCNSHMPKSAISEGSRHTRQKQVWVYRFYYKLHPVVVWGILSAENFIKM